MSEESQRDMRGPPHSGGAAGFSVAVSGLTHVGMERGNNEDAFAIADARTGEPLVVEEPRLIDARRSPLLLAVSDGMGGERAGEVASDLTLDALRHTFAELLPTCGPAGALRTAIERANDVVVASAAAPGREGMGATLVATIIDGSDAYIAAVGDSRAYLLRSGQLVQLTRDQSLLQYLLDRGGLSPEELKVFPYRNIILQAIGRAHSLRFPLVHLSLRRRDRLLLCSDGLSGEIDDETLRKLLSTHPPLDELCRQLIVAANAHGGHDNITVVVASADGDGLSEPVWNEPIASTIENLDGSHTSTTPPIDRSSS